MSRKVGIVVRVLRTSRPRLCRCIHSRSPVDSFPPYAFQEVERTWAGRSFATLSSMEVPKKFYVLSMFPYPSGNLHMGHVRVYTITDVIARFKKMQGFQVIHPMGWDAFGLPAENAAIDHGVHPRQWTDNNIARMKEQMQLMGTAFDWSRELSTCHPSYYKWTQQLFLRLHRAGLVYQKEAMVNWDPIDQTVLANEQVDANGRAERSGAFVEQRMLKQWFFRITAYAEDLLHDLDHVNWPQNVKQLQANWIGRTQRYEVSSGGQPRHDGASSKTTKPADPQNVAVPKAVHYRLRDWLVSRQRYWGTPIPVIHCPECGPVPVPDDQLPVLLPDDVKIKARSNSLTSVEKWHRCECPKCKSRTARRETDTMDTFVDSAWYWLRYSDPANSSAMASPEKAKAILPVDIYIGGVEHSIMHLLYARFIAKFLQSEGIVDMPHGEPFKKLVAQGMVQGLTYRDPSTGRYLPKDEIDISDPAHPIIKETGEQPLISWEKMSKSKYNGVDPSTIIAKHGSDAVRLYMLYKAAPADELAWDDRAIVGMERWLGKIWKIVGENINAKQTEHNLKSSGDKERQLKIATHTAIQEVTTALNDTYGFHVAIACLIKLTHAIEHYMSEVSSPSAAAIESVTLLLRMLAPFAPCISQELWCRMKGTEAWIFNEAWPEADNEILQTKGVVCAVMVNGKTRGTITVPPSILSDTALLKRVARESEIGKQWLFDETSGKAKIVTRVIIGKAAKAGKGRVVSFVVK